MEDGFRAAIEKMADSELKNELSKEKYIVKLNRYFTAINLAQYNTPSHAHHKFDHHTLIQCNHQIINMTEINTETQNITTSKM